MYDVYERIYSGRSQDTADIELIPEREDAQPDSPLEDTVSVTLKRENSIRRSQRKGRLEHKSSLLVCVTEVK